MFPKIPWQVPSILQFTYSSNLRLNTETRGILSPLLVKDWKWLYEPMSVPQKLVLCFIDHVIINIYLCNKMMLESRQGTKGLRGQSFGDRVPCILKPQHSRVDRNRTQFPHYGNKRAEVWT